MLPIPAHLQPFFVPSGEENTELHVTGAIRCKCGGLLFTPFVNDAATIAAARCAACKEKLLLFHAGRHGWDGFVAKAAYLYDLPGKLHAVDACPACGAKTRFALKAAITSFGREDFIRDSELTDEDGKPLSPEDWVNAFSSFRLDAVCPACGHAAEGLIDIETA